jgi:ion channel
LGSSIVRWIEIVAGLAVLAATFYDLFQSVVLPRPAVGRLRLTPYVIRPLWVAWRTVATRGSRIARQENRLGVFGPTALLVLLSFWAVSLIVGYGLILDGVGDQLEPASTNLGESLYTSATTLLPLAYGDVVPVGLAARVAVIAESASGLSLVALVITLLFSLYASFQRREEAVVTLDALAGAPPSGIQLLETAAKLNMREQLKETFTEWRAWSAAVLESHLAYPILVYFRSSHDNEAWLNSFGAVMDAATLVSSAVEDPSDGQAHLMLKVGNHLVEDFVWYFNVEVSPEPFVERSEFDEALERLGRAGYRCKERETAWTKFVEMRSRYAAPLNQFAHTLAVPPAQWISDRSYLPHRQRERRGRRRRGRS